MTKRPGWRFLALGVFLAAVLAFGARAEWKRTPADAWTQQDALEVLTDSPWSKTLVVWQLTGGTREDLVRTGTQRRQDAPGEIPIETDLTVSARLAEQVDALYSVRWSSARIVGEAVERLQQTAPHALYDLHAPPPALDANFFVLTARVVRPAQRTPDLFSGLSEAELRARAELRFGKKQRLQPERVVRHGLGAAAAWSFFFPRAEPSADTAEFVFRGKLGDELKAKFKLKEMQRNGEPDY